MAQDGVDQLKALSRRLKDFGDKGLKREFTREITAVLKPLRKEQLPHSAMITLPKRGGLNLKVAKTLYRVSRKTGVNQAGIRLQARYMYNIFRMDRGRLRHPVFKRKGEERRNAVWVNQNITPGWFTNPTNEAKPDIQAGMKRAMEHMARQLDGAERIRNDGNPLL